MSNWREDRIGAALAGENPTVLARLPGAFAVIGDVQWLPGYCVLLTDDPTVNRLSDLAPERRQAYLQSVDRLAAAVERACGAADPAFRRVNIEILGNTDPFLHTHVWPRYDWEPEELRSRPVWLYPTSYWRDPADALGPQHDSLRASITAELRTAADSSALALPRLSRSSCARSLLPTRRPSARPHATRSSR
jgi:diadenosine tetraphosphate (Ap4A) HIT family hydrolase